MNCTASPQHLLALARFQCPILDIIASHARSPDRNTPLVPVLCGVNLQWTSWLQSMAVTTWSINTKSKNHNIPFLQSWSKNNKRKRALCVPGSARICDDWSLLCLQVREKNITCARNLTTWQMITNHSNTAVFRRDVQNTYIGTHTQIYIYIEVFYL